MLRNLKKLREEAAVTQKALADAIGVSQQSINKYENHNIEPDIGMLIRIADFFDTSVDYLIGHSEIRRPVEAENPWSLTDHEMGMLQSYRKLTGEQRESIDLILRNYNHHEK